MSASSYDAALARLLVHEGGYTNNAADPGGPTNFGITIYDYRKYVKPDATAADVDQLGIRIATPLGDSSGLHVSRLLKQAEMVRTDSFAAGLEMLRSGQVHAFTASRVNLIANAAQIPGSRVLEDGLDVLYFAALIPKGQAERLVYVSEFIRGQGLGIGEANPRTCGFARGTGDPSRKP